MRLRIAELIGTEPRHVHEGDLLAPLAAHAIGMGEMLELEFAGVANIGSQFIFAMFRFLGTFPPTAEVKIRIHSLPPESTQAVIGWIGKTMPQRAVRELPIAPEILVPEKKIFVQSGV